ncbi:MAG: hypothetical protein JWO72_186 [Caulobacteraceae bacterium]|nr:hypothetical protein [Caulobacteraceae bacterium]
MTDQAAPPVDRPIARPVMRPVTRAFLGGAVLGLLVGVGAGFLLSANMLAKPAWTDVSTAWVRLPEQTVIGALPQTFSIPASSYDFGGVAQPLGATLTDTAGIIKVDLEALAGRVGVSLARPDGGELVSREAIVAPQQGKTSVYLHTAAGAGPVALLLRSADSNSAGASVTVSKVQAAPEASLGKGQMDKINRAGVY